MSNEAALPIIQEMSANITQAFDLLAKVQMRLGDLIVVLAPAEEAAVIKPMLEALKQTLAEAQR